MSEATIDVSGLHKRFGDTVALDGLSFAVAAGSVTGFVGPNGAGKSTTMRVILGLDSPDAGEALVGGRPYATLHHPLRHVGSLLDASALQPSRSARNHLLWQADSQRIAASRVDSVIEMVGLESAARRKAGRFSLGMRQRLGIAAALLGDPPVLIMDEPFNGMDPEGIVWMRGLLRSLASEGRAILISSHLMSELQDLADHVVMIGRGRVLADAGMQELIARASGNHVLVRTEVPEEAARALRNVSASEAVIEEDTVSVSGVDAHHLVQALTRAGVPFSEVTAQRATLEDVYFQLTESEAEFRGTSDGQARG